MADRKPELPERVEVPPIDREVRKLRLLALAAQTRTMVADLRRRIAIFEMLQPNKKD